MLPLDSIDNSWTLFIDRDGVINHEKYKDYIHTWDEFVFYDGVLEAMSIFSKKFKYIIVVTNQKGVGKGLTTLDNLQTIHQNMQDEIQQNGGRIDSIYFCSDLDDNSLNRKPNPGMGLMALQQFPAIDVKKSIMIGNTLSDMEFGRNLGTYTVFLPTTHPEVNHNDNRIDLVVNSLKDFSTLL